MHGCLHGLGLHRRLHTWDADGSWLGVGLVPGERALRNIRCRSGCGSVSWCVSGRGLDLDCCSGCRGGQFVVADVEAVEQVSLVETAIKAQDVTCTFNGFGLGDAALEVDV